MFQQSLLVRGGFRSKIRKARKKVSFSGGVITFWPGREGAVQFACSHLTEKRSRRDSSFKTTELLGTSSPDVCMVNEAAQPATVHLNDLRWWENQTWSRAPGRGEWDLLRKS